MGAYLSAPVTTKEVFEGGNAALSYGGATMQGWRRTNEDAHLADVHPSEPEGVFGVFDGHGGCEVARFCQRHLATAVRDHAAWPDDVAAALVDAFHAIDAKLASGDHAAELAALRAGAAAAPPPGAAAPPAPPRHLVAVGGDAGGGAAADAAARASAAPPPPPAPPPPIPPGDLVAGTTAVVAVVAASRVVVANAGDSRCVLARADGTALALSTDHKPGAPAEAARIRAAGGFVSSIGGVTRVNGNLSLSRAIGDLHMKGDASRHRAAQVVTAEPDVVTEPLEPGDAFLLLACDGIWDVLDRQGAVDVVWRALEGGASPAAAAAALLDACLSPDPRATRGAGCDNMTALVAVLPGSELGGRRGGGGGEG